VGARSQHDRGTLAVQAHGQESLRAEMRCQPTTPLLGRYMLPATWANVREHAAGPLDYWGSRGRRFESGRPDKIAGPHERAFAQFSGPFPGAHIVPLMI